jgi:orotate phosphoribosyltransferase
MEKQVAIDLLEKAGALLTGHFLLTSGNHSAQYIQCALLLSHPELAVTFMEDIASHFRAAKIDTVAAPAVGGIIVSYEIGRLLSSRTIFLEREQGQMSLRRGFSIRPGEKVLIVEDVITTGRSVLEVGEVIKSNAGELVAFASIVNRSEGRFHPDVPYYACVSMDIPIYLPRECPLCAAGVPAVKPGSRGLA